MFEIHWWKKLRAAHRNADGVRDRKVQAERHKAEIKLAELRHVRSKTVEHKQPEKGKR